MCEVGAPLERGEVAVRQGQQKTSIFRRHFEASRCGVEYCGDENMPTISKLRIPCRLLMTAKLNVGHTFYKLFYLLRKETK